jgi:DNA-binding CsgD family transcriptional regulator
MPGLAAKNLIEIIGAIHDAALEPTKWQDVIDRVRQLIDGSAALLFTPMHTSVAGGLVVSSGLATKFLTGYTEHFHQYDIWTKAGIDRGLFVPGKVVTDEDLTGRTELLNSYYYREFLAPANTSRLCCAVIFGQGNESILPTVISIYRGVDAPPFERSAKNLLRLVVPHLTRSLNIMYRLRDARNQVTASLAALDRITSGVLLFDRTGRVLHANRTASALLAENDGLSSNPNAAGEGQLHGLSASNSKCFRLLIENAGLLPNTKPEALRCMRIPRPSGRPPLALIIAPVPASQEFHGALKPPAAVGFLIDTTHTRQPAEQLLETVYGLTPAEVRLVRELAAGKTISEIANLTGVSPETPKSQLKSIFQKTGTRRQVDVIRIAGILATQY